MVLIAIQVEGLKEYVSALRARSAVVPLDFTQSIPARTLLESMSGKRVRESAGHDAHMYPTRS
jgi:hypothetical protein